MPTSIPLIIGTLNRKLPLFPQSRCEGPGLVSGWFDAERGTFRQADALGDIDNPAFLALGAMGRTVYCTSEMHALREGAVSAVAIDRPSLALRLLNSQTTLGNCPSYCSIDTTGGLLLATNYLIDDVSDADGVSAVAFPLEASGVLGPARVLARLRGQGPVEGRQNRSHAHCIIASLDNRHAIIADLGGDALVTVSLEARNGEESRHFKSCALPAGSGPRHMIIHPKSGVLYLLNELSGTLTWLAVEGDGQPSILGTVSARHPGATGDNASSDLKLSADGRFVYAANRGDDSIAAFAVGADGGLSFTAIWSAQGLCPRNLALSPDGGHLLVSNQNSDTIAVFVIDRTDGSLSHINDIAISTPMCAVFL